MLEYFVSPLFEGRKYTFLLLDFNNMCVKESNLSEYGES